MSLVLNLPHFLKTVITLSLPILVMKEQTLVKYVLEFKKCAQTLYFIQGNERKILKE